MLKHRGPDSDGEWYNKKEGVYIGHTRLSQINFLDFSQIKEYLEKSKEEKNYKYDQFTMLLISINYFLKLIYEKK